MPDVRVFRNDGTEMFANEPDTLAYIDPGVVLLYADTATDVVCTYLEGRLGQPVQATAECRFEDGIDLQGVRPAIEAVNAPGFSLEEAPHGDVGSARWALDGLDEDPLRVGERELDAIKRLIDGTATANDGGGVISRIPVVSSVDRSLRDRVDGVLLADTESDARSDHGGGSPDDIGETSESHSADSQFHEGQATDDGTTQMHRDGPHGDADNAGAGLDFAVRSTYDAARFFAFLVDALADTAATVAVSKAGRVDAIADADVVIHPDGDLKAGSRVEPLPDTQERIDVEREHATKESLHERFVDPVDDVGEAYRDAVIDRDVDRDMADTVLRKLLASTLDRRSSLTVVDRWRARYRRARIAVVAALLGLVAGVLGAEELRFVGWRVETAARRLATADPTVVRTAVLDAATDASGLAVPAGSVLVLMAALVMRRRQRGDVRTRDQRPSTARSDLVRLALTTLIVIALVGLLASGALLLTG